MFIIEHRVNSIRQLLNVPKKHGIEIDVQAQGDVLVTGHDPGEGIEDISDFLGHFNHKFLALNIKQEGIEVKLIQELKKRQIEDFFLFDVSFPQIVRLSEQYGEMLALRISDMEDVPKIAYFRNRIKWLWVDCFYDVKEIDSKEILLNSEFKKCLVSPELHPRLNKMEIEMRLNNLKKIHWSPDAVCTKIPGLWSQ